ncbi:sigma-70 family RNA polymerase sigma factor [candidate division KSB1 bacterium]|nr:sigma-70 family RNA polymerase sigma factor [candidate division KSB1 bacterium]
MNSTPDEKLVSLFQAGDVNAFEALYHRYSRSLVNFMMRMLHDEHRAEDLFQDIFIKLLEMPEIYQNKARFKIWLYRVAMNRCLNDIRNRKKRREHAVRIAESLPKNQVTNDRQLNQIEAKIEIRQALAQLPAEQQAALILKYYQNLTYPEIAEISGCPVGTIKSRLHYAIENLRLILIQE